MNLKQTVAAGLVAVIAFGTLAFMPASADSPDRASAAAPIVAPLNAQEIPQHLVWDMTYGDQGPMPTVEVAAVEPEASPENMDAATDLSMG